MQALMHIRRAPVWPGLLVLLAVSAPLAAQTTTHSIRSAPRTASFRAGFEENLGQLPRGVRFAGRTTTLDAIVLDDGAAVLCGMNGNSIRIRLDDTTASLEPTHVLPGLLHYLRGPETGGDVVGIRCFGGVSVSTSAGVVLSWCIEKGGLRYGIEVPEGVPTNLATLRIEGAAEPPQVTESGELRLSSNDGDVVHSAPRAWCGEGAARREVHCRFVVGDATRIAFEVEGRAEGEPLIIDPFVWSTYLGGSGPLSAGGREVATDVSVAPNGEVVATGQSDSWNFPVSPGAPGAPTGSSTMAFNNDVFVAKYAPDGTTLIWATMLPGSSSFDMGLGVAVNAVTGQVAVCGYTGSFDFPTTPGAFDRGFNAFGAPLFVDGFLSILSSNGMQIDYSTYVGMLGWQEFNAVAFRSDGSVALVGHAIAGCAGPTTPTPAVPNCAPSPGSTVFGTIAGGSAYLCVINPNGAGIADLVWGALLGGGGYDEAHDVAVDDLDRLVVYGFTANPAGGTPFPTTAGSFQPSYGGGGYDAFVAIIDPATSSLVASTLLGGSLEDNDDFEHGGGISMDAANRPIVVGRTLSPNFPTTGAPSTASLVNMQAFVVRLSADLSGMIYGLTYGSAGNDDAFDVTSNASGAAAVVGTTFSTAFPVTPGAPANVALGNPAYFPFALVASPTGEVLYSATLGGRGEAWGVAWAGRGEFMVAGLAAGPSTPAPSTPGVPQPALLGSRDAWIARYAPLPTGASALGSLVPLCPGTTAPSLAVRSHCISGNPAFGLTVSGAPPASVGLLAVSSAAPPPILVIGCAEVLLNLPALFLPVVSDADGYWTEITGLPLPTGTVVASQSYWVSSGGVVVSSNGLGVVVQ